jgi:hypothetical protein
LLRSVRNRGKHHTPHATRLVWGGAHHSLRHIPASSHCLGHTVSDTRSRTHGPGRMVSDPRSRTHGLGLAVSDPRSRTRGHGQRSRTLVFLLRGSGAVLPHHNNQGILVWLQRDGGSPPDRAGPAHYSLFVGERILIRTCGLGLSTKESWCGRNGTGAAPRTVQDQHTILCLWSRTRCHWWRSIAVLRLSW